MEGLWTVDSMQYCKHVLLGNKQKKDMHIIKDTHTVKFAAKILKESTGV